MCFIWLHLFFNCADSLQLRLVIELATSRSLLRKRAGLGTAGSWASRSLCGSNLAAKLRSAHLSFLRRITIFLFHLLFPLLHLSKVLYHFLSSSLCDEELIDSNRTSSIIKSLFQIFVSSLRLHSSFLFLGLKLPVALFLSLREGSVDDSESQIEEEESPNKDKRNEEDKDSVSECHLVHLLNFRPTF